MAPAERSPDSRSSLLRPESMCGTAPAYTGNTVGTQPRSQHIDLPAPPACFRRRHSRHHPRLSAQYVERRCCWSTGLSNACVGSPSIKGRPSFARYHTTRTAAAAVDISLPTMDSGRMDKSMAKDIDCSRRAAQLYDAPRWRMTPSQPNDTATCSATQLTTGNDTDDTDGPTTPTPTLAQDQPYQPLTRSGRVASTDLRSTRPAGGRNCTG